MKQSRYLLPTLKETPNDVVLPSHALMLRAGLIRKTGSGFYTYLPFGLKALKKVEKIIREEMNKIGGQEFLFPLLINRELWDKTGRWATFRGELFRLKDRGENEYALGPTHEESFTDFFKQEISSYKQLPLLLYQIATKFRDEIRPRYGVMRSKEFLMKDAYSFHLNDASLDEMYRLMIKAYSNIFKHLGLDFVSVRADSGAMGGSGSEEFMVKSSVGEETLIHCGKCGYGANIETAEEKIIPHNEHFEIAKDKYKDDLLTLTKNEQDGWVFSRHEKENFDVEKKHHLVHTPDTENISVVAEALGVPESAFIKCLLYEIKNEVDGSVLNIMLLLRADYQVNSIKLQNLFPNSTIDFMSEEKMKKHGYAPGYVSPFYFLEDDSSDFNQITQFEYYIDESLKTGKHFITGNNHPLEHLEVSDFEEFKTGIKFKNCSVYEAKEGGACLECGGKLDFSKGIEVGHIFKLGRKYTEAFQSTVLDEEGKSQLPTMGCYGIGINRTLAAIVEQYHDDHGIKWPQSVAPFDIHLITLNIKDEASMLFSKELYENLSSEGLEVLWDERDQRAGFKFKDADLLGLPIQVIVGPKNLAAGEVEIKFRNKQPEEKTVIATKDIFLNLKKLIGIDE